MYMDVDSAVIVPVNILPLLDDTDFKTVEQAIVYNSTGIAVTWNFVTTAGVVTQTAITPTTGGVYDWSEPLANVGMYAIEIPASGGASANNNTEGFGWITGTCTGVLPWRGPTIGFRAAALNNSMMDGATVDVNVTAIAAGAITAAAIATGAIDADAIADNAIDAGAIASDAITAAKIANGAIDAATFAAGAIDAAAIAANAIDAATFAADMDAEIAAMVWNAATASYGSAGTYGEALEAAGSAADPWLTALPGAYSAGTAGNIIGSSIPAILVDTGTTLDALIKDVPTVAEFEARSLVAADYVVVGDTLAAVTTVGSVSGAVASVTGNIGGNVAGNVAGSVGSVTGAVGSVTGAVGSVTGAVGSVTGAVGSVGAGGIAATTFAAGAITAAAIADAAIDAATFAADADAEIAAMVWNAAAASYGGAGTYGQAVEDMLVDTGTTLDTLIKDIPTVAEFEARSLVAADYTIVSDLPVAPDNASITAILEDTGTTLDTLIKDIPTNAELATALGTADDAMLTAIADVPTVAEFEARTIAAADYLIATDTLAAVTAVGSVTGAVGSVTGAVGSVTGAVGSVTGAVGSIAAGGIAAASFAAGAVDAAALSDDAIDAILDEVVEGTTTMRQMLRVFMAALAGKAAGGGTTTLTFRNIADNADRITATVDADGNRTAITLGVS